MKRREFIKSVMPAAMTAALPNFASSSDGNCPLLPLEEIKWVEVEDGWYVLNVGPLSGHYRHGKVDLTLIKKDGGWFVLFRSSDTLVLPQMSLSDAKRVAEQFMTDCVKQIIRGLERYVYRIESRTIQDRGVVRP